MRFKHGVLLLLVWCFFWVNHVQAQEATPSAVLPPTTGIDITVSPPILNISTEPDASFSAVLKVKNNNFHPEALKIEVMKFMADETGGRPKIMPLGPGDIFPQWMNFSETEFEVPGNTWKTIDFKFMPPANASPAYYFAISFFRQQEAAIIEGQVAHAAPAILGLAKIASSRVYHQLDLNQLDGKTIGFTTDHSIYEFLPVNFQVNLVNNGNVHELAYGNIFIDWTTGKKTDVSILDVNKEKSFILPQTQRTFTSTWAEGFPLWVEQMDASNAPILDKKGKPVKKLNWDLAKLTWFRIGKYTGNLVMIYNDGIRDVPIEAQVAFWVIPWRILLALLVIIIIIGFGLRGMIMGIWKKYKEARLYAKYKK